MAEGSIARDPAAHSGRARSFWRHFLEMLAAMVVVGMFADAAIFLRLVRGTWDDALVRYQVESLLVMAVSMTVGAGSTAPSRSWRGSR